MIVLCVLGLLLCFYVLAKICEDYFVQSLDLLAKKLQLSQDVAGATLMAIGSSAPELFLSLIALTKVGAESVGAGAIVGSAIFNVLVIVGVSAVVATAYLDWRPVVRDMCFYIVSILVLLFTFWDGRITIPEVSIYLVAYAFYILLLSNWSKFVPERAHPDAPPINLQAHEPGERSTVINRVLSAVLGNVQQRPSVYLRTFFVSILAIGAISWVLVELAVLLAHALNIAEVIIALTVLAAGTSIPDLISSMIVAKQGRGGMAVSNAVGSNTFDILFGLGFPWLLFLLITGRDVVVSTENLLSSIFLLFCTVVAMLLLLAMQRFKLGRSSGWLLIVLYVAYLAYAIYVAYHPGALQFEQWLSAFLLEMRV